MRTRRLFFALLSSVVGCATGCQSMSGAELAVAPAPMPLPASAVQLPRDAKFSIALAPSQRNPGLDSAAEAESVADRAGAARAFARITSGGNASAEFQLGHSLANDSDQQVRLALTLTAEYEHSMSAGAATTAPEAVVELAIYLRDAQRRLIRTIPLLSSNNSAGGSRSNDRRSTSIELLLGARQSVIVYLAGGARVETQPGRAAECALELKSLTIDVQTTPAAAAPAGQP